MGRITIPRRYDAFNRIFLAQEQQLLQPSFLADEIYWSSEWLPGSMLYQQEFNREEVTPAAGVTPVLGSTVPAGELWFVPVCEVRHNDAAARLTLLRLEHVASGGIASVEARAALATSDGLTLSRPVLVPAGHRLQGNVLALAAGSFAELRYYYLRLLWGEPIPRW